MYIAYYYFLASLILFFYGCSSARPSLNSSSKLKIPSNSIQKYFSSYCVIYKNYIVFGSLSNFHAFLWYSNSNKYKHMTSIDDKRKLKITPMFMKHIFFKSQYHFDRVSKLSKAPFQYFLICTSLITQNALSWDHSTLSAVLQFESRWILWFFKYYLSTIRWFIF